MGSDTRNYARETSRTVNGLLDSSRTLPYSFNPADPAALPSKVSLSSRSVSQSVPPTISSSVEPSHDFISTFSDDFIDPYISNAQLDSPGDVESMLESTLLTAGKVESMESVYREGRKVCVDVLAQQIREKKLNEEKLNEETPLFVTEEDVLTVHSLLFQFFGAILVILTALYFFAGGNDSFSSVYTQADGSVRPCKRAAGIGSFSSAKHLPL